MSQDTQITVIMPLNQSFTRLSDYYWQTAQTLADRGYKVYGYAAFKPASNIRKQSLKRRWPKLVRKVHHHIWIVSPFHILPFERFKIIYHVNQRLAYWLALQLIRISQPQTQKYFFWSFHPSFSWMMQLTRTVLGDKCKIVYETPDYLSASDESVERQLRQFEKESFTLSDVSTTNCPAIVTLLKTSYPRIKLSPAGFKYKEFRHHQQTSRSRYKKVIGYCGSINYRIDYDLLINLISSTPEWDYHFIGPQYREDQDQDMQVDSLRKQLFEFENVTWTNQVAARKLADYMVKWDAAIIPYHLELSINKYCNPTKLMEYFYLGLPVVSTPMLGLKKYSQYLHLGSNSAQWQELLETIFSKPLTIAEKERRRQIALSNTWDKRIRYVLDLLG